MAKRIVVVGAGIGGVPAAYALKRRLGDKAEVTVVSDSARFEFVPSNPWVALGWRKPDDISFPIAAYLEQRGIVFVPVAAQRFEPRHNRVVLEDARALEYDFLVVATGPAGAYEEVPGLGAQACSVMRCEQARAAFAAYQAFAAKPGPVLVGAAQRSAILGPVYEMAFLIDADLRRRHIRQRVPITLVTPEPYPGHLGLGGQGESRRLLEEALEKSAIDFVGNATTERIEKGRAHVLRHGTQGDGRTDIGFAYSVYWPPFCGVAALRRDPEIADERGFVRTEDHLRSERYETVFALGACVARPQVAPTEVPIGAPESVYSIENEAEIVAANIAASIAGTPLSSALKRRTQWISDAGEHGARYLSQPHVPLENVNWLRQGTWVHLAKGEFEKYFLNRIKLGMQSRQVPARSELAAVVARLVAQRLEGTRRGSSASGPRQRLEVGLELEPDCTLEALAKVLDCTAAELAAALLKAAIDDAQSYVGGELRAELEAARRAAVVARVPEPVRFQGGAS